MHEDWLQKYIQEHYLQIGFSQIHGPYKYGADFKGIYANKSVKIEAEWEYSDYIKHKHSLRFADILVVATLNPPPYHLKEKLPSIIINLDHQQVLQWAQPRIVKKNKEDYYFYPWRKLSRSLLLLYVHFRKQNPRNMDFIGSNLALSIKNSQTPNGFQFGSGGMEIRFNGTSEDKDAWDYWLIIAHAVAYHFQLKPTLLHPTWIDRLALYFQNTGIITQGESKRFEEVALFIDELFSRGEL